MAPRSDTRDRVLRAAARLFRRQGYEATGLKELVAESEAPWGSLYHFFPGGKEHLGVEAVRMSGAGYCRLIAKIAAEAGSAAAAVQRMFDLSSEALERSDFADGCPIANVAVETANTHEALRHACSDVFHAWTSLTAEQLEADGLARDQAQEAASFVVAAYEGAVMLARAHKDTAPIRNTARYMVATIESLTRLAAGRDPWGASAC
jgi:TetR/AcrR family transcriptional regulator, lmrAB and yxaGH operons repressor